LAILGRVVIGLLRLEKWVEPFIWSIQSNLLQNDAAALTFGARIRQGWRSSREIFGSVWPYIVGGIGVPLYANVAGVLPITEALVGKGLPLGTVLSFTMAVTALSLPEMVILRKVLRPQLLAVFIAVMTTRIIGVGYLFKALMS
jgi:uncharacterized membrane protein YraQ (UPF0718 family)